MPQAVVGLSAFISLTDLKGKKKSTNQAPNKPGTEPHLCCGTVAKDRFQTDSNLATADTITKSIMFIQLKHLNEMGNTYRSQYLDGNHI